MHRKGRWQTSPSANGLPLFSSQWNLAVLHWQKLAYYLFAVTPPQGGTELSTGLPFLTGVSGDGDVYAHFLLRHHLQQQGPFPDAY
jgi:hypothetical protein